MRQPQERDCDMEKMKFIENVIYTLNKYYCKNLSSNMNYISFSDVSGIEETGSGYYINVKMSDFIIVDKSYEKALDGTNILLKTDDEIFLGFYLIYENNKLDTVEIYVHGNEKLDGYPDFSIVEY